MIPNWSRFGLPQRACLLFLYRLDQVIRGLDTWYPRLSSKMGVMLGETHSLSALPEFKCVATTLREQIAVLGRLRAGAKLDGAFVGVTKEISKHGRAATEDGRNKISAVRTL